MKIFLGTLNGGGDKTLTRLYNSIKNFVIPQLHGYEWVWSVLSQGSKGANEQVLKNIKLQMSDHFTGFIYKDNIGVTIGTNDLIDYYKELNFDLFWMIDDDIEFIDGGFLITMLKALFAMNKKTCATTPCFFGKERNEYTRRRYEIIDIIDHGSGCTLYNKDVYEKCGYYDENLKQYGTDSEFNNKIRLAFGDKSLSLIGGNLTKHYNQTGTFNCYSKEEWNNIVKKDNEYLKNKIYDKDNIYQPRVLTKLPTWKNFNFVKII